MSFGYNEQPITFLCVKIIDSNVKKFGYNEHPLIISRFHSLQVGSSEFQTKQKQKLNTGPGSILYVPCTSPHLPHCKSALTLSESEILSLDLYYHLEVY